jgi:hypothetical protein
MAVNDAECDLDDRVRELLLYWRGKRNGTALPSRSDIDPAEIRYLLPLLFLADVSDDGKDFRFRLAGSKLNEFVGVELTGRTLSEFRAIPYCREHILGCREALEQAAPVLGCWRMVLDDHSVITWQSIFLPLAPDGRRPDMIFGLCCIQTREAPLAPGPSSFMARMTNFSGQRRILK